MKKYILFISLMTILFCGHAWAETLPTNSREAFNYPYGKQTTISNITLAPNSESCPTGTTASTDSLRPCAGGAYHGACFLFAKHNTTYSDSLGHQFQYENYVCTYQ